VGFGRRVEVVLYAGNHGSAERMGSDGRSERDPSLRNRPIQEVVPPRAVLTELARGFLMVHQSDPVHAARFARSFLKEQVGPAPPDRVVPMERLPGVRRGLAAALRENPQG
jgi:hypothetical protein